MAPWLKTRLILVWKVHGKEVYNNLRVSNHHLRVPNEMRGFLHSFCCWKREDTIPKIWGASRKQFGIKMPRLYIGRINHRVTERDLKRFFDGYGRQRDMMMKNGYAFIVSNQLAPISFAFLFLASTSNFSVLMWGNRLYLSGKSKRQIEIIYLTHL